MEPPRKRPRLHLIGSVTPEADVELEVARRRNDKLLKTNWEHVFERYEKDFTGVGDEIGIFSGAIEVDNGHLRSMLDDRDTGHTDGVHQVSSSFDGKRMLRAMTAAPSDASESIPDADEVFQSIETIADNAMLSGYSSTDDLFDASSLDRANDEDELSQDHYLENRAEDEDQQDPTAESEHDDLNSRSGMRSPSPDDLFDADFQAKPPVRTRKSLPTTKQGTDLSATSPPAQEDISETRIRDEVRRILQEEREQENDLKEARVETAWRIPVTLPSTKFERGQGASVPRIVSTEHSPAELDDGEEASTPMAGDNSLWRSRPRRARHVIVAERNLKMIRAESEDPLQEGFTSDVEESLSRISSRSSAQSPPTIAPRKGQSGTTCVSINQKDIDNGLGRDASQETPLHRRLSQREDLEIPSADGDAEEQLLDIADEEEALDPVVQPQATDSDDDYVDKPRRSKRRKNTRKRKATSSLSEVNIEGFDVDMISDVDQSGKRKRAKRGRTSQKQTTKSSDEDAAPDSEVEESDFETETTELLADPNTKPRRPRKKRPYKRRPNRPVVRVSATETSEDKGRHPWQIPVSRSGQPVGNLSRSLRRNAADRYKNNTFLSPAESSDVEERDEVTLRAEREQVMKAFKQNKCWYCKCSYTSKNMVGPHWDRVLVNFVAMDDPDPNDPHDIEFLHDQRSKVERRTRPPKTILQDFRSMVELHEGSGLSFDQIAASKLLWSCKDGSKLQTDYLLYRQLDYPGPQYQWQTDQEEKLWKILQESPGTTSIISIHKKLGRVIKMSFIDLGNKMADKFLEQYSSRADPFGDQLKMYNSRTSTSRERQTESAGLVPVADVVDVDKIGEEPLDLRGHENAQLKYESEDDLFSMPIVLYTPGNHRYTRL